MSLWVESADSSEKRISASAVAEPSAPIDSARSHSPRRIASTPSWMAVAPEAQAVDSVIGRPRVPNRSARRSAIEPNWVVSKMSCFLQPARHPQQPFGAGILAVGIVEREAVMPVELDRRRGEEERATEIAGIEAGFGHGLMRGGFGQLVGQQAGAFRT